MLAWSGGSWGQKAVRASFVTDVGRKVELWLQLPQLLASLKVEYDYILPVALPSPLAVTCDAPDGLSLEMSI